MMKTVRVSKLKAEQLMPYVIVGFLFLLLTNLAYINFVAHEKPGYKYTGANPYAPADKLVYMSMVEQGREGILFMKNLHTTDPQKGLMLSPHWYLIGQTARLFNLSNNASYQLYRVSFTVLFVWLLYLILQKLFSNHRHRVIAGIFVLFSGGLGWLYVVQNPEVLTLLSSSQKFFLAPIDLYVTEGNTLLNFSQSPLFSLSQLLLLVVFYLFIRFRNKENYRWDMVNAFIVALLGIMHPYDVPIIFAVLGSWSVWYVYRTRRWYILKKFFIIVLGGLVAIAYGIYLITAEPVLAEWLKQNLVYSPPFRNYLWGYGLLLPLWVVGTIEIVRKKQHHAWWILILIWSSIIWLLLYLPLEINRRFINGFHIALALVAFVGFRYLYQQCRRLWLKMAFATTISMILFSSISFFLFVNLYFAPSVYQYKYYYISSEEEQAIAFLAEHSETGDRLLTSDVKTSFTITSQLNRLVFRGHDHQTPRVHLRQQQLEWFFAEQVGILALNRKRQFLADNKISYIVVNQKNIEQPSAWLSEASFAQEIFSSDTITIYRAVL